MSEVLFNSARPLGRCENITAVYDAYDGPKRFEQIGYGDVSWLPQKVVVTDEFVTCKRPNQIVVMIAHGLTGGKLYGVDQPRGQFTPDRCGLVDYYVTSSEVGRKLAASASGIPIERCVLLGMPRTDAYFGKAKGDGGTLLAKFNRAYLYAPTFRASYDEPTPRIDWAKLDAMMDDDEVLVVKPHIHQKPLVGDVEYAHVVEASKMEASTPYLIDCDVLATDFSSILFDGYVLGKPSVLTADMFDPYLESRGMYWKYPGEYGSRFIAVEGNEAKFLALLRAACETGMRGAERGCLERTASACDGHSTERVIELVESLIR